jgi:uncharacterized protein
MLGKAVRERAILRWGLTIAQNGHMFIMRPVGPQREENGMTRPHRLRQVGQAPPIRGFKPMGIPMTELDVLTLQIDELEALRLADQEGLYQEEAAGRMGVSRVTFGRILQKAHAKVAEALVEGKALLIGEGPVLIEPGLEGRCPIHGGPRRRGRGCRCPGGMPPESGGSE